MNIVWINRTVSVWLLIAALVRSMVDSVCPQFLWVFGIQRQNEFSQYDKKMEATFMS